MSFVPHQYINHQRISGSVLLTSVVLGMLVLLQVPAMWSGRAKGSALAPTDQDHVLHGMIRAAYDEVKGTGDGLDDGETNVLKKFQTKEEQEALRKEIAAREAAEREHEKEKAADAEADRISEQLKTKFETHTNSS